MKKSDKRVNEFTITIRGDAGNAALTIKGEDRDVGAETTEAIKDVFEKHGCKLLDVFVDA